MFLATLAPIFILLIFGSKEINSCEEHVCKAHESEEWSYGGSNADVLMTKLGHKNQFLQGRCSETYYSKLSDNFDVSKDPETSSSTNLTCQNNTGPSQWPQLFPTCNGTKQSPIDIITSQAVADESLVLTLEKYNVPIESAKIQNNGHTIQVTPDDYHWRRITVDKSSGRYTLYQFHFHWGCSSECGSEHTIDGKAQPIEMHLVHEKYGGDIAVIGILFSESENNNPALIPLIEELGSVQYKEQETTLKSPMNLSRLVPEGSAFYRYDGSLTTPECNEGVIWTVLRDPVNIGSKQMEEFRRIFSTVQDEEETCSMCNNFRRPQPLNNRTVKCSQG